METHVLTFTITKLFSEWAKGYDASAPFQKAAGITSLYRGVSTENPNKVMVIHQAAPGVATKLLEDNKEMIESAGHIWSSTQITTYNAS